MTATTAPAILTPAQQARAERLAAKQGRAAKAEMATTTKGGKAAGTVTPAPKPSAKGKSKAANEAQETARLMKIKADEAAAKKIAADQAREKRDADKLAKAEAKAKRDAEREASRKEREEAQVKREEARRPQIMGGEFPAEFVTVKTADVEGLVDLVGAAPSPRLVKSVKDHGVLESITLVRRNADDTAFRLSGGRRRIMAAKLAGASEIPALIYTVGDKFDTWAGGATLHLNVMRSDNVAADVLAIKGLQGKYTLEQIARETGMPLGTVKKRVRLLGLPDRFLQLLYTGKVPHTVLTEASSLDADQLDALYRVFETTGRITKKDVDALRRANRADAAEGLDFDSMMDGAPDAADVTTPATPIKNTGDLSTDLITFLSGAARQSGIQFDITGEGVIVMVRDGQMVQLQGRQGNAPAVAPEPPAVAPVPDEQTTVPADEQARTPADEDQEFADGFDPDRDDIDPA